ncbi:hypothetical protein [Bacillus thuringiensis]|uniref:hypothetical protein n=1 Tax=Bacillus thuringiensis TaxID=1428 RepID=UPI002E17B929|nr:hypothetical protein [Bacillus thuringiensis]
MLKDKFEKETVFEGIKKHAQLNLKYAPVELICVYDAVRRSEIYEDFKGDEEAFVKTDLCFTFLEELNFSNVKLDMDYSYEEILKYRIYYSLWIFVVEETYSKWEKIEITNIKFMELLELKKNTFYKILKEYEENNLQLK